MLSECLFRLGVLSAAVLALGLAFACSGSRPQQQSQPNNPSATERKTANACSLLSETEIAGVVGNDVSKGHNEASTDICKWDAEDVKQVDVLLIVREKGGTHEPVLCADVRANSTDEHLPRLGDVAIWKFSRQPIFNSGDLEVCGPKGYLTLTLNGRQDEAALKAATTNLAQKILARL